MAEGSKFESWIRFFQPKAPIAVAGRRKGARRVVITLVRHQFGYGAVKSELALQVRINFPPPRKLDCRKSLSREPLPLKRIHGNTTTTQSTARCGCGAVPLAQAAGAADQALPQAAWMQGSTRVRRGSMTLACLYSCVSAVVMLERVSPVRAHDAINKEQCDRCAANR